MITRRQLLASAGGFAAALTTGPSPVLASGHTGLRIMSRESALLRSEFFAVDDQIMHTLVSVPEAASEVPIVLVHGLALSGQYMVPVAEALAPDFRVLAPDFPGFGDSSKPDFLLDVPGFADWLAMWAAASGIDRAVYLGNSFGCQIIVDFAARYPHLVAGTILQGPTTPPEERSWFWQFIRWQQNSPNNPPLMEDVADIDYRKCGYARALGTFHHSLRDRPEDKLADVRAPSLVIRGQRDPICNQDWAESVARGLPDGRLVVLPDVAHTLVFTSGEELAEVTRSFMAG